MAKASVKTETKTQRVPAKRRVTFGKLRITAVPKFGFYRCGFQFDHKEETVLTVVKKPVTRTQISIATANKLRAERLLIVREG